MNVIKFVDMMVYSEYTMCSLNKHFCVMVFIQIK